MMVNGYLKSKTNAKNADYFMVGNLMQNYAFNVELAEQQIRRTASSYSKYASKLWQGVISGVNPFSTNWWWGGYSIDSPLLRWYYGTDKVPDFDMKVLEKDGSEWDYGNKAMFMCWEVLYDHGYYDM